MFFQSARFGFPVSTNSPAKHELVVREISNFCRNHRKFRHVLAQLLKNLGSELRDGDGRPNRKSMSLMNSLK